MDSDNPIKEYTGVWIPAEVMESDELEPLDKLVYGEIASFRECYGSNAWLAKRIKRSEKTASRSVQKLIQLGFVENAGYNGRFRILRVAKFVQSDWTNLSSLNGQECPTENKVENKVENNNGEEPKKSEYGNHEVNALLELWEHETGLTANVAKANRLAAYNLIRKKGFDGAKAVVELVGRAIHSGDKYAPRIASFRDLQGQYEKLSKLEAWEARQTPVQTGVSMSFYERDSVEEREISDEDRAKTLAAMRKVREEGRSWLKGGAK